LNRNIGHRSVFAAKRVSIAAIQRLLNLIEPAYQLDVNAA
jgi:hypothetical protein